MQVNIKDLDVAIMFSTIVMNEETKQWTDKLFLEKHWLDRRDPFPQVKSAKHMAKINTKIICLRSGAFPNFSWKLY